MTEEQTFRRLKKLPFLEVHQLYWEWRKKVLTKRLISNMTGNQYIQMREEFFNVYGWTGDEYESAREDYIDRPISARQK